MSITFRGKAVVEGIMGVFNVIAYNLQQTGKATQNWDEEIITDVHGGHTAWIGRNEHLLSDFGLKFVDISSASSATQAASAISSTGTPGSLATSGASLSLLGQPFMTPYSAVSLGSFTISGFNGLYQVVSGNDADLANTKVGDWNLKLRKYADAAQATLSITSPS
jgi:hypothetical protein